MFEKVSDWNGSGIDLAEELKTEISRHLHAFEEELNRYFSNILNEEEMNLARNPFASQLDMSKISNDLQDKLLEMINDSSKHDLFIEKPLSQFWFSMQR